MDVPNSKLAQYLEILTLWNKTHRLTGDIKNFEYNFEDSIYPLNFIDDFTSMVDIGSGAGFPGLCIALQKPNAQITLLEPNNKKNAFLRFAALELGLANVSVSACRAQDYSGVFDLITSRAVADTSLLLDWTTNLRNKSTKILLYKGEQSSSVDDARISDYELVRKDARVYLYIKACK